MMKYIGVDLWDKRVWLAISQENIAFPLIEITRTETVSYLKKYFSENTEISTIIVGLPYDLYGVDTRQLDKTLKFIEKLRDIFSDKEIIGHDERFSSFQAGEWFDDHKDDIAAQCILQSYLDSRDFNN